MVRRVSVESIVLMEKTESKPRPVQQEQPVAWKITVVDKTTTVIFPATPEKQVEKGEKEDRRKI